MSDPDVVRFDLMVSVAEGTEDEIDNLTRSLLRDLKDLDVESVKLALGGSAPDGTKAIAEVVTAGAIALAVLPNALPKIIEFLQAWSLQGRGRTIKFKGKIAGQNMIRFAPRSMFGLHIKTRQEANAINLLLQVLKNSEFFKNSEFSFILTSSSASPFPLSPCDTNSQLSTRSTHNTAL